MICIQNKKMCCGCTACSSICPQNCINMICDKEGFQYPVVDIDKCVDCHLCEVVCPIINNQNKVEKYNEGEDKNIFTARVIKNSENLPDSYVAFNKDKIIREDSTSGGVFSVIANHVIKNGGRVYGVAIDENKEIVHVGIEDIAEIGKFRGSKYVQSNQQDIYAEIEKELKTGREILYSGTPCQVAGLKSFLRTEYKNLLTVDIFCHGVGSPKYWNKYVAYMEQKFQSHIERIKFREKTYGYNSACMAVYFENGKSSHKGHDDDLYWTAFSKCYIFRPSCYECMFKTINHVADFSIGDFWDSSDLDRDYLEANGCTLLLVHSHKGKKIMDELKDEIKHVRIDLQKALDINGGPGPSKLIVSSYIPNERSNFLNDMDNMEIDSLILKYMPLTWKQKLKCEIKPWLYNIGLLEFLKKLVRK